MRTLLTTALLLTLGTGVSYADPLTLDESAPILFIDGAGDSNVTVTVAMFGTSQGSFDVGRMVGGSFVAFGSSYQTFNGGEVVDFAIRDRVTGEILSLSGGDARMTFFGAIAASNSANPVVDDSYWAGAAIVWESDTWDITISLGARSGDGMTPILRGAGSPVAPVPEPGTLLLFGLGCVAAAGARRRRAKIQKAA
jgi:hypothetical protein